MPLCQGGMSGCSGLKEDPGSRDLREALFELEVPVLLLWWGRCYRRDLGPPWQPWGLWAQGRRVEILVDNLCQPVREVLSSA